MPTLAIAMAALDPTSNKLCNCRIRNVVRATPQATAKPEMIEAVGARRAAESQFALACARASVRKQTRLLSRSRQAVANATSRAKKTANLRLRRSGSNPAPRQVAVGPSRSQKSEVAIERGIASCGALGAFWVSKPLNPFPLCFVTLADRCCSHGSRHRCNDEIRV